VDYSRFERLVIAIGATAIVGTAALTLGPKSDPVELIAQLLLLVVLVGAARWGRRGGTAAAVVAIVAYVAIKGITAETLGVIPPDLVWSLVFRAVTYALVGVIGGEACARMKNAFARAQDARAFDEVSSAYTPAFLSRLLTEAVSAFERYGQAFSVVVIAVDSRVTAGMRSEGSDAVVRSIATHLRDGLRLVDEVGRLPWGAFAVLLPQTGESGANVVADRLRADLREGLSIEDAAISVRVMSAPEDLESVKSLAIEAAQSHDTPQERSR
jgi:GGDEF domain-containing protein